MFHIYDDPEPLACLRYMMSRNRQMRGVGLRDIRQQKKTKHTRPGAAGMQSQEALPQVLALFRHGGKILRHGRQRILAGLAKSSVCTGGIPEATGGQGLHGEHALSCLLSILLTK